MTSQDPREIAQEEVSWYQLYNKAKEQLASTDTETSATEAKWIVEKASGYEGAQFASAMNMAAPTLGIKHFEIMLKKRLDGEPLQYALGSWGFRNLDLFIDDRVLIPRPETEILVDVAHKLLTNGTNQTPHLVGDFGTGSGAIGLSIAQEREDVEVILVDSSEEALKVAAANLTGLGNHARKVQIIRSSWFETIPEELKESFSLVVSNPPYISTKESLPAEVANWEPHMALYAGEKGTEDIETILDEARIWLQPKGALAIEMAPNQIEPMSQKAKEIGYENIEIHKDLTQKSRVMSCLWKS